MSSFLRYGENTSFGAVPMTERCKVMTMNEKECCERIREIKKFVRYPDGAKMYSMIF